MNNLTTCPNCGHQFDAGEALQKHLDIELKKRAEQQDITLKNQMEILAKRFEEEKKTFEENEKRKMWAIAQQKAEEKIASNLKVLQEENQTQKVKLLESQKKEIELLQKEKLLNDQKETMVLDMQKQLLLRSKEIEDQAKKKKDEEFELVKKEFEKKLEDQMNLVKEMQRKAEQGSMQLQGEIQELAIEELLSQTFIYDQIEEIKKGQRGADAIQTVINEFGIPCGRIIFESKRTQAFGGDWIEKLKDDQRAIGADLAVLVTQVMPKDMPRFGEKEGVWICNFNELKGLVYVLRQVLVRSKQSLVANENKSEKMGVLYNFLISNEFKMQVEAIVEGFSNLKSELDKEKRAMQRIWKEREVQIEKVIVNTIDMYGSIKSIAGNAIQPIQMLELGNGDQELQ